MVLVLMVVLRRKFKVRRVRRRYYLLIVPHLMLDLLPVVLRVEIVLLMITMEWTKVFTFPRINLESFVVTLVKVEVSVLIILVLL